MIAPEELESRIKQALPDAVVQVNDMTGGQDHYQVDVVSAQFSGKTPIQRHRMVYAAFDDVMGGALHALSIQTRTPDE